MEDPNAKSSLTYKKPVDLPVGGEGRENSRKACKDAWNRILSDLWRSDAVILLRQGIIKLTQRQKSAES